MDRYYLTTGQPAFSRLILADGCSFDEEVEFCHNVFNHHKRIFKEAIAMSDMSYAEIRERVTYEFTELEYVGDACEQLIGYLQRCWARYQSLCNEEHINTDVIPCGLVVQSYGFGKSRVLYQLAHETIKREELGMRVLYLCTRMYDSSGYPIATNNLKNMLFRLDCDEMSRQLETVYHYAYNNWSTVGEEWIKVFTSYEAAETVMGKIWNPDTNRSTGEFMKDKTSERLIGDEVCGPGKVVILAVDCASGVLTSEYGWDYTPIFRSALVRANERIREYHRAGGIFALLADQKTNMAGFNTTDISSKLRHSRETVSFPSFVLTATKDVFWRKYVTELGLDEIAAYKFAVTHTDRSVALEALLSMGRPLWTSTFNGCTKKAGYCTYMAAESTIELAACKLLVGGNWLACKEKKAMFGVASLLCRLGLRWRMNALQSSYSVSHFMATLSYLRPNGDGIKLVEYSSDPVLALGATMIWYGCPMGLSEFILPEFTRLFVKEELDVANVNESAACIVLLLAMDTCVVIETNSSNHMSCSFMGQFLSVDLFLKVLGGHDPPLMTMISTQIPEQNQRLYNDLEIWRSRWADWKLGFCHFIQLTREPNEHTLWYLLGRRAAGIFAHEQNEVDLIIPIFRESEVSMILTQVEGTKDRDGDCPEEDIQLMDPFCVFSEGNPLRLKKLDEIIRVSIVFNETERSTTDDPDRYFLFEGHQSENCINEHTSTSQEPLYVGCKFALYIQVGRPWDVTYDKKTHPVISPDTAVKLIELTTLWGIAGQVINSLYSHREAEAKETEVQDRTCWSKIMPDEQLVRIASYARCSTDEY